LEPGRPEPAEGVRAARPGEAALLRVRAEPHELARVRGRARPARHVRPVRRAERVHLPAAGDARRADQLLADARRRASLPPPAGGPWPRSGAPRAARAAARDVAAAAGGGPSPTAPAPTPPAALSDGWTTARPEEVGLDGARLAAVASEVRAGRHGRLPSPLVVRSGRLAFEEYFGVSNANDVHTLQSVTKSVTSLL